MKKAFIFDADGTLLDSMKIWMEVTPSYLMKRGKIMTEDMQRKIFSMSLEQGAAFVKKEFNLSESEEEIKSGILEIVSDFYKNQVQLKKGVYEFLKSAYDKNIKMCVATAGNKDLLEAAFKRLGCEFFFTKILTCTELGCDKSSGEIFIKASEEMNADISETIVFEDALVPVSSAKRSEFYVVAIEDIFSLSDKAKIKILADEYLKDFSEINLANLLQK